MGQEEILLKLVAIANRLDKKGLRRYATEVDELIVCALLNKAKIIQRPADIDAAIQDRNWIAIGKIIEGAVRQ